MNMGEPQDGASGMNMGIPQAGQGGPADALEGLRAYHLPDAPAWWPPAPGWWLLAGVILILLVWLGWWLLRRHRRRAAFRQASTELQALRKRADSPQQRTSLLRDLSKLLRRYALAVFPGAGVAGLAGEDWLLFLDRHGGDDCFTRGPGRQLLAAPYVRDGDASPSELIGLVEQWVRRNAEASR